MSMCSVTGTWSHLRLSQHTLSVQTMSLSVDRALCFPSGPHLVRIPESGCEYMLSSLWFGLGLYAFGMDRTTHLCVTVTLRAHVLVIVRVVSELSRLPQLSVSAQHSKVHNPISSLLLFAILKACFR